MKLAGNMRLGRPSFKVGDGKNRNERKDSSRARDEDEDFPRDETFRYYDSREVRDSARGSERGSESSRDSQGSSSDGSLDEQITFISETDLPVEQSSSKKSKSWKTKKFKGFPIIATIKKKIRRKKNKKNERNMNHLEIIPQDEVVIKREEEPTEPTQWEKFMDTVAFPEKQLAYLYSNFVDYVSKHEKKTPSTQIIDYDQFKKVVEQKQLTKREPLVTDKQWEDLMDTIAFPQKCIPALFSSPNLGTKTTNADRKTTNAGATRALEMIESNSDDEEEDEQKDPIRPVIVTMFKTSKFDSLGLRLQHLYGRTGIYIAEIVEGSKSDNTKLKSGMEILTINGKPCPESVEEVYERLSILTGYVSIKAVPKAPYSVVSSSMDDIAFALKYLFTGGRNVEEESNIISGETSTSSYVDSSYMNGDESTTGMSTSVETVGNEEEEEDDDTPVSSVQTPVQAPPQKKTSVVPAKKNVEDTQTAPIKTNDAPVASPPVTSKRSQNEIDYVELARQPDKQYELVFAIKKRCGEWVGLSLMRNADWPGVYIEKIDPRSKFACTQLSRGMKLVEINGRSCPEDLREAIYMIFYTDGTLELTVEDSDGLYCHEEGSLIDTLNHDDFRENYGGFLVQNLRLDG